MKKLFLLCIIFFITSAATFVKPVNAVSIDKMKGICVHGEDIEKFGAEKVVSEVKNYGYNTIFFLIKNPSGKVFYKSSFMPMEKNVLPSLITEAHRASLKLYIYFPVCMDKTYGLSHPNELMQRVDGKKNPYYISLISDNYLNYMKMFLSEVLRFNIDGVALDYIRFPNGSYDFSDKFNEFAKENSIDVNDVKKLAYKTFINPADWKTIFLMSEQDKNVAKWASLRKNIVKKIAFILRDYIKSIKPNVQVGAFSVARGLMYKDIFAAKDIKYSMPYQIVNFGQNPSEFYGFDFVVPMVYLKSLKVPPVFALHVINEINRKVVKQFPIYIAINPYGVSSKEIEEEIFYTLKYGQGVVLFRFSLFSMGKCTFASSRLVPGKTATAQIQTSKGVEKEVDFIMPHNDFVPIYDGTIFLGPLLDYHFIVLTIGSKNYTTDSDFYGEEDEHYMDTAPFIKDSRTFVPVRFVSENLGAKVSWNGEKREVTIKKWDTTLVLTIQSHTFIRNGKKMLMDTAPFIKDSRTFVPVRFVSENLGAKVSWNGEKREVTIEAFSE